MDLATELTGRSVWGDGALKAGRSGGLGHVESINPPLRGDQSCPLAVDVSADDTLSLPGGPFPGRGKRVCLCVSLCRVCMFVCVRQRERTPEGCQVGGDVGAGAGFCQSLVSPECERGRSSREGTAERRPSGELGPASSPRRASDGGSIQSLVNA